MVDRAEVVCDPVAATVVNQEDVNLAELGLAAGTAPRLGIGGGLTVELAGLPMSAADRPRNHVLEAAEHRPPLPRRLVGSKAVVGFDRGAAPGALLAHQPIG